MSRTIGFGFTSLVEKLAWFFKPNHLVLQSQCVNTLGSHLKLLYLRVTVTTKVLHDQICAYSKSNRFPRSLVHENEKGDGYVRRLPHALHLVLGTTHPKTNILGTRWVFIHQFSLLTQQIHENEFLFFKHSSSHICLKVECTHAWMTYGCMAPI